MSEIAPRALLASTGPFTVVGNSRELAYFRLTP